MFISLSLCDSVGNPPYRIDSVSLPRRFRRRRVDDRLHLGDLVGGETALARVLADRLLVGGDVDAEGLVFHHVAVDPLDLRADLAQGRAGLGGS
jgi:hypothetical protein